MTRTRKEPILRAAGDTRKTVSDLTLADLNTRLKISTIHLDGDEDLALRIVADAIEEWLERKLVHRGDRDPNFVSYGVGKTESEIGEE